MSGKGVGFGNTMCTTIRQHNHASDFESPQSELQFVGENVSMFSMIFFYFRGYVKYFVSYASGKARVSTCKVKFNSMKRDSENLGV